MNCNSPFISPKIEYYLFNNLFSIIIPTKVKNPIISATNTVSATDAKGSRTILIILNKQG